ncbi:hypothetical protein AALO_G00131510, partial [Alosa alosa]
MAEQGGGNSQRERAAVTGPDLQGAFEVICHTPEERLLSITLQMGGENGSAEQLVQAMALIALRREADALQRLHALGGHRIAAYLAGQVSASQGQLEDLRVDTFEPPEPRVDTLRELARIYRVLVQERLCEASLRDQAYQAALLECRNSSNDSNSNDGEELRHTGTSYLNDLIEEVRGACGVEMSLKALRISSNSPQPLATVTSQAEGSRSHPTSLTSSTFSSSSLPSHLEISATPTQPLGGASHTHSLQISTQTQAAQQNTHTQAMQDTSIHTQATQDTSTHTPNSLLGASTHTPNPHTGASTHTPNPHTGASTHTPNSLTGASTHTPNPHTGASSAGTALVGREAEGCSGPGSACHTGADNGNAAAAPGPAPAAAAPGPAMLDMPSHPPTQCSGRGGMHQLVTSISTCVET